MSNFDEIRKLHRKHGRRWERSYNKPVFSDLVMKLKQKHGYILSERRFYHVGLWAVYQLTIRKWSMERKEDVVALVVAKLLKNGYKLHAIEKTAKIDDVRLLIGRGEEILNLIEKTPLSWSDWKQYLYKK